MDAQLIRRWNERIKPEDTVIHMGDFCFRNSHGGKEGEGGQSKAEHYLDSLNGDVICVRGNHDKNNSLNTRIESLVLDIGGHRMFCCHRPDDIDKRFEVCLVGHVHGEWKTKRIGKTLLINVGVDVWDYRPVSLEQILKCIQENSRGTK